MKANEIRNNFFKYFEQQGHKKQESSSLIPQNDPSLLFTNAGMVQFKDQLTGASSTANKRVVSIQKCVRAGGKHNDLDNVGFTARHHTFFEMLGNFSFGDYFKKDAIHMGWEFITKVLKLDPDRLYVTVHHLDTEAAEIWAMQEKIPRDRIFFRGDKDNFWEMGQVGPCGPCSEIFYDHGEKYSDCKADISDCILDDERRYVEIWNLVFMQYEKYKDANTGEILRRDLKKTCIDTGAGLERIVAATEGIYNNFDTACFASLMNKIEQFSLKKYSEHLQEFRVIADHARSSTMLLNDGVIPSNEGRGYVLRRIIRRAIRFLDLLGVSEIYFFSLAKIVIESLGDEYLSCLKNLDFIEKYLYIEEQSFRRTMQSGIKLLEKEISVLKSQLKSNKDDVVLKLSGQTAFLLYDTHGFPIDLTQMIGHEKGVEVDISGFDSLMKEQRERSKSSSEFTSKESNQAIFYQIKESKGNTVFLGYQELETEAILLSVIELNKAQNTYGLIFDQTVFYAESGGQRGDIGSISGKEFSFDVIETSKEVDTIFCHKIKINNLQINNLKIGEKYKLSVLKSYREEIKKHHSATHLLQAALVEVLGPHIKQAGSNVSYNRLRFDFTHPQMLTDKELKMVESKVNRAISENHNVDIRIMRKKEAISSGARALFGEKYGDSVRVVDMKDVSVELCGGTHVQNTGEISIFKIISEASLATGVRRIEAVASKSAIAFMSDRINLLSQIESIAGVKNQLLLDFIIKSKKEIKEQDKKINKLETELRVVKSKSMFDEVETLQTGDVFKLIKLETSDDIQKLSDLFLEKYNNGIIVICAPNKNIMRVIFKTYKNNTNFNCSTSIKNIFSDKLLKGKGGGKQNMAQGSFDLNLYSLFEQKLRAILI